MIESEFNEVMALLDNLWGGLDEGLEAGYRWLLDWEHDDKVVYDQAVRDLANGIGRERRDTPFLPKAPEFSQRVEAVKRRLANEERLRLRHMQIATTQDPVIERLLASTGGGGS